jgi:hypothetical protein
MPSPWPSSPPHDRVLAQAPPDLTVLARLAVQPDHLHRSGVPANLRGLWVALCRFRRAEAMARFAGTL